VSAGAEAVGEAARESVVYLELIEEGVSTGHATGWFVEEGVIATNAHNVRLGVATTEELRGYTPDGRSFETDVLGHVEDISPDVAILGTEFTDAPPLPVRRDAELEVGDPLVQVGHPGGFGNWVISAGRFAGRTEPSMSIGTPEVEFTNIVTSIPGLKGVSGSPVLDLDGEVVAMTTGGSDVDYREFGDPVRVAPDRVFDAPISPIMAAEHVGIDATVELVDRWA
jgi:serine protease Do